MRVILPLLVALSIFTATRAQYDRNYFFWIGRNYLIDNKYREAIDILNVLLRSDTAAYEGYFLRGVAKYNLDDIVGAEQDFTLALRKNPVYTLAYQYRAISRSLMGNYDDALKDFQEAIYLRPDYAGPYFSRGVTYLLNQQFDKAIADFNQFLKQEPRVADAYINRGAAYLNLRDTVRALEDYDRAVSTNREYPVAYNRRGFVYLDLKRYGDALTDFNKAIEYDSLNIQAYFNRALVYSNTNRPMDALADFDKVLGIDSTSSVTYFNRAIVHSEIGAYNDALKDYDKVSYYSPNNVLVYYNRASLYAYLGDFPSAVGDYSRAIELYPDFANAYLRRASLREILRDDSGAQLDRETADAKIAEYSSKLNDSTFSIYADTSRQFNRLLSFDTNIGARRDIDITAAQGAEVTILPMYKFSFMAQDAATAAARRSTLAITEKISNFENEVGFPYLSMVNRDSGLPPDSLVAIDKRIGDALQQNTDSWQQLFLRGISQSLIKQYTNSIANYTAAIDRNPTNPFLYLNRSTTQTEMTDFISSLDNSYQRITIDSDPASRLNSTSSRIYNYDSAIADLNSAAKLMPEYAVIYYNRGNLYCKSGMMPEAIEDYSRAVQLDPDFAEAYFNRGLIQIFLKDTQKGSLDLSKAGELGIADAYRVLRMYGQTE